jgi:hypothetical protein
MAKWCMPVHLSQSLQSTIDKELPNLRALSDADASISVRGGWTRKQELGHLIDSATNNHARFVNIALADNYKGASYDPDGWVAMHGYEDMDWSMLVDFWYACNSILAELVERIPDDRLTAICEVGTSGPMTLQFLIGDYVVHMQHHLDQALGKESVTQYPQANTASHP